MKITNQALDIIRKGIISPTSEMGGILGSSDGELIDNAIIDVCSQNHYRPCSYYPNTDFLNQMIDGWQNQSIHFMGVFHSHFAGVKTLSKGDTQYITLIIHAMPDEIKYLFFPIFVLPDRELVCYKAKRDDGDISITSEVLHIV